MYPGPLHRWGAREQPLRQRQRARLVALRLYNVRTRRKETFVPRDPQGHRVGFYLCGLTVYDHMHIGHARTAVAFEVIRRWLERTYEVTFVQNVTDVDDKIIARATELGVSPLEHAATWDEECARQSARLGVRPPDIAPHATTSMEGIVSFIERILAAGFAYATDGGNVYFDVPGYDEYAQKTFPESAYGTLSRRDYREMAAGTRKDVETDKRHPADFALWKAAKPDEPADARWASPWSEGRPGWHIECSHMSTASLGSDCIDIHGGGQDLIFPHHENEIAQTQAASGTAPFVNYWVHTGFLNVEGQKMSKSLGNFITLKQQLDEMQAAGSDAEALRYYFTLTHYRSKIDFQEDALREATKGLERLRRLRVRLHQRSAETASPTDDTGSGKGAGVDAALVADATTMVADFGEAMDDDLHTPGAVASLFTFQKKANAHLETGLVGSSAARAALEALETCGQVLTLFQEPVVIAAPAAAPAELTTVAQNLGVTPESAMTEDDLMARLLAARSEARTAKDWGRSDAIRDALQAAGYIIHDNATGSTWERAS